jgi:hypothetical protein
MGVVTASYRITIRGALSDRFAKAFEGMAVERGDRETVLVGPVADQTQLWGLLDRLRDFGFELVRVEEVR